MSDQAIVPASDPTVAKITDPTGLQAMLETETERRKIITAFIASQLVDGVDYGRIHISKACNYKETGKCNNPAHWSKACLFKPGAEKFCSLMHLKPKFRKDTETLSMLPEECIKGGAIALVCELFNEQDSIVSEGRGVCSVVEKGGALNTAIKIAQKRSLVDSVLRAFSISDTFTMDIEREDETQAVATNAPEVSDEEYASAEKSARDDAKFLKWGAKKVSEFSCYYLKTKPPFTKLSKAERFRVFNGIIDTANDKRGNA